MVDIMRIFRKKFFTDIFNKLVGNEKKLKIGFYGHPNSGKTTLANRMTKDWLGKPLGLASEIPHETRRVYRQERVSSIMRVWNWTLTLLTPRELPQKSITKLTVWTIRTGS